MVRDPTFKFSGFRERYRSALYCYTQQLYTITTSTLSATCNDCVDGRGLFQERGNFKNVQNCYEISKSDSRFEIGLQFRNF